jgi:hypothetical protein
MSAADYMVSVFSKEAWVYELRGKARAASGDFDGAIADFEVAIKDPDYQKKRALLKKWVQKLKSKQEIPAGELLQDVGKFSLF